MTTVEPAGASTVYVATSATSAAPSSTTFRKGFSPTILKAQVSPLAHGRHVRVKVAFANATAQAFEKSEIRRRFGRRSPGAFANPPSAEERTLSRVVP